MIIQNRLAKAVALLIFLMPLVTVADDDNKKIDPFAEAKAEPKEGDIEEVKLDDIVSGMYSGDKKKGANKKKPSDTEIKKKQPPKKKRVKKIKKKRVTLKPKKAPKEAQKTIVKKAPKVESKPERELEPEIDLMKAYSALMETSNKKKAVNKSVKKEIVKTVLPKPNSATSLSATTVGWLYLGKFNQEQWDKKGNHVLGLQGVLPKANHYYSIRVPSNIRKGKPSKGKMPSVIKVLSSGSKIQVLTVHNSGRSGHYWAKIAW
jgi:outer membrane biosynthesis protein TonB